MMTFKSLILKKYLNFIMKIYNDKTDSETYIQSLFSILIQINELKNKKYIKI